MERQVLADGGEIGIGCAGEDETKQILPKRYRGIPAAERVGDVAITGGAIATTNDNTPAISGTTNAADGRILTVTVSTQTLTTPVAGGMWAVDVANLADGIYNVTASLSVADGTPAASAQSLTINTVVEIAARLTSVEPARVLETRSGPNDTTTDGRFQGAGRRPAESVLELTVAGRGGVPANAEAVMMNLTAVFPDGPGFFTVFPCGTKMPTASNVNYSAGDVVPNAVLAKIGNNGKVCIYTLAAADMVADINGYVPAI